MKASMKLSTKKKVYNTKELMDLGFTYYKINQLISEGFVKRLSKSYYENSNYDGEASDFLYIKAFASEGVICLMSAAVYYDLTTYRPDSIDVAVPNKKKVSTLPDWPSVNLYYFDDKRYNLDISRIRVEEDEFKIYSIEKTVADIISYRNKVGIEETKEILTNYLKRRNRHINKLVRYSKELKCYDILNSYLEVLL